MSGVHWKLAGSVGAQEPVGYRGQQGHWGLLGGVGASGGIRGLSRACRVSGVYWVAGRECRGQRPVGV